MRAFTALFGELDRTTRTGEKLDALRRYFALAPAADAAVALHVLSGGRVRRAVSSTLLRRWVAEHAGLPEWLVEECYSQVGDLAETLSLLLPEGSAGVDEPLHSTLESRIFPLPFLSEEEKRARVVESWGVMDREQRLVFHKLITGGFRVGVAQTLVVRAVADVAGIPPAVMAHRLTGDWVPSAEAWNALLRPDHGGVSEPGHPYPFFLAHPLEGDPAGLGPRDGWQVEWKWDGIRAQLIRRGGSVLLWSRGEELITHRFPEVADAARALPEGTVLDGELLSWGASGVTPFHQLQRRLNRKSVSARLRAEVPVRFLAWDLLERDGEDVRARPLAERRAALEALLPPSAGGEGGDPVLALSPLIEEPGWEGVAEARDRARGRGVEGVMLKRLDSPFRVGRPKGDWWKWKVAPHTVDAVLLYAQRGHGRRAGLYTDYTFGVWDGEELVTVAKAYSGLADAEIREVDRWIRAHTTERFGPVRAVEPGLVFELAFEGIQHSPRHRAGVALRFPRMARWRRDKPPAEADTLTTLRALIGTPP